MLMIHNFACLFLPLNFCTNISHFESTIVSVDWMSSNFLSLNLSKTVFLLIGRFRQLAKLKNPKISLPGNVTLCPCHLGSKSWCNL